MIFEKIYRLRVIYKSGAAMEFNVTQYEISPTTMKWHNADENHRPLHLNYEEVASVWKVGQSVRLKRFW